MENTKEKTKYFLDSLKTKNRYSNYYIGLAVYKNQQEKQEIINLLEPSKIISVDESLGLDNKIESANLLKSLFEQKGTLVIEIVGTEISPLWYEQIKRLAQSNNVFIQGKNEEDTFYFELNGEQQIVFLISDHDLENNSRTDLLDYFALILRI
jgi:hypothetical protein